MESTHEVFAFSPDMWAGFFESLVIDSELMQTYNEEVAVLKEQVQTLLVAAAGANTSQNEKMNLVDTLERLGLSYHFEKAINDLVEETFNEYDYEKDNTLFAIALHFRKFRQHGHNVSNVVFNKFKDERGEFIAKLSSDIVGMISLYEASYLRAHGEEILEEALSFTKANLNKFLKDPDCSLNPLLEKQVKHALEQPLQREVPRLQTRFYIDLYEVLESRNDTILRFAKIDYNRLQLLYQQELSHVTRYWKDMGLATTGSDGIRNRAVESYCWAASAYFEPQYSVARVFFAKTILLVTLGDDTFDEYGTFEELKHLNDAIQNRWDSMGHMATGQLPHRMQPIYKGIVQAFDEFEVELTPLGYDMRYAKNAYKAMFRGYYKPVVWLKEGYTPTFEEYMRNALETTNDYMLVTALVGMGDDIATKEAFEWTLSKPKIAIASSLVGRYRNDISDYKKHYTKGHKVPTSVDCYMMQYKVSLEEAIDELYKRTEDAWKDINEQILVLRGTGEVSNRYLGIILNLTRAIDMIYKNGDDGFTHPRYMKDTLDALYVIPVPV